MKHGIAAVLLGLGASFAAADASTHADVRLAGRKVVQPADGRLLLRQGDTVTIRWRSDERVQLHVHGYDLAVRVEPGEETSTPFVASATGRFPVTSHGFGNEAGGGGHRDRALLFIEVHPR